MLELNIDTKLLLGKCDKIWVKHYKRACKYRESNFILENIDDEELQTWLYKQKKLYENKKLSDEKIILLNALGIEWDYMKKIVRDLYDKLETFFVENNNSLDNLPEDLDMDYKKLKSILSNRNYPSISVALSSLKKGVIFNDKPESRGSRICR